MTFNNRFVSEKREINNYLSSIMEPRISSLISNKLKFSEIEMANKYLSQIKILQTSESSLKDSLQIRQESNNRLVNELKQLRNESKAHLLGQKEYTQKIQGHCFTLEEKLNEKERELLVIKLKDITLRNLMPKKRSLEWKLISLR